MMAWTVSDLDTIEKAIASGTKVVQYSDKKVEYQAIGDMLKARDAIRGALIAAGLLTNTVASNSRVSYAEFHSG